MEIEHFAKSEKEFGERVQSMVWCKVSTVDPRQRHYSRILHPLWEGKVGWILTHRDSHNSKHFDRNPIGSLTIITKLLTC